MKIAVTGAQGFTGRHFCAEALRAGHEAIPLNADLTDRDALQAEIMRIGPDAAAHLAAISFVGHADEQAFYNVNVIGTTNLLAALAAMKSSPRSVLLASSANIYGNSLHSPIGEDEPPAPVNHYATSKLAMEYMAMTFADRLPLTIVRPFNYTGPGQAPNFVIPKIVAHFRERRPAIELGNIHVEREFNDVRMVCAAYLALLDAAPAGETFNVCTGEAHTLQHVIALLQNATGHTLEIKTNPAFMRTNEVHRLCGDPGKLSAFLKSRGLTLQKHSLDDTLQWMLNEAAA